jgi:hypothetical protein
MRPWDRAQVRMERAELAEAGGKVVGEVFYIGRRWTWSGGAATEEMNGHKKAQEAQKGGGIIIMSLSFFAPLCGHSKQREVLKITVEDAFLFQPLKSRKDAKEAVFLGVFWHLFAVKINF